MTHTHFIAEVPVSIQMQATKMNDYLKRKLTRMFTTLYEMTDGIEKIDVRMEECGHRPISPRTIAVTIKLSDVELRASDSGKQWKLIMKHVQQRLKRQVEKRKELLKKPSVMNAAATESRRA